MRRECISLLAGVLVLMAVTLPIFAQTGTGVIRGVVQDPNKAVIPGAEVTLTNEATNWLQKSTTSEVGIYYFGAVPRGTYNLTVQLPGFRNYSGKVELQVGQTAAVDIVLEVGTLETSMDVVSATPVLATESTEVADIKTFERIQQLPLNGRRISNLFVLTPGVEGSNDTNGNPLENTGANSRVNGLKVGAMEISQDGVSTVNRFGGGAAQVEAGLDTVQEYRIETVGSDARYSRPATVTIATRSGTNAFHGSVFETHRNNAAGLRARKRDDGNALPKLIRNEFGASTGGPLYFPRLYDGKNKTFWFASLEGLKQRQARPTHDYVPTDAMWNGDLSNLIDPSGQRYTIYDPLTTDANGIRQPFPNNVIPSDRISPFAKELRSLIAKPTNDTNPNLDVNFVHTYPRKDDYSNLTIKGDHAFSERDRLSIRWTRSSRNYALEGGYYGNPIDPSAGLGTARTDTRIHNVAVSHTHTFTPSLLNELQVGVNRSRNSSGTLGDYTDFAKQLGLPNPFGVTGWPTLYGVHYYDYYDGDNRKDQALTSVSLNDNLTWVHGQHTLQFGGNVRREYNNVRELQQAQGSHAWDGSWTALYEPSADGPTPLTGDSFADILLGLPSLLTNQYNRGFFYFRQMETGLYFNDSWKVSPRLTLTLGLRYDRWTPYDEKLNRLVGIDSSTIFDKFQVITPGNVDIYSLRDIPPSVLESYAQRGLTYSTAESVGYPNKLFRADNNNFIPRIGAVFSITSKTLLRAGFGQYYWPLPLSQILQSSRTNPPLNLRYKNNPSLFDGTGTYTLRSLPGPEFFLPNATVNTDGVVPIDADAQNGLVWDGRNWRDSRSDSWHFSLEREILPSTVFSLRYVGDHGRNLEQRNSLNSQEAEYNYVLRTGLAPTGNRDLLLRRNPNWNVTELAKTGYSNTHSAQVMLNRNMSSGLAFQVFYAFSRSLNTTDAGGASSGSSNINSLRDGAQVPENIQLWGAPNLTYEQRMRQIYFNSTNVPPHRVTYNFVAELPFGKGKRLGGNASGVLNALVGGWQVASLGTWRSGFWSSVNQNRFVFDDPRLSPDQRVEMTIFGRRQRLWFKGDFDPTQATNVTGGDLLALVPVDRNQRAIHPLGENFDNTVAQQLNDGTIRNTSIVPTNSNPSNILFNYSPRAFILGPRAWFSDVSFVKNVRIKESVRARLSADFINFFNHPNDIAPSNTTGLQDLSQQANEPRTIQLSLRIDW